MTDTDLAIVLWVLVLVVSHAVVGYAAERAGRTAGHAQATAELHRRPAPDLHVCQPDPGSLRVLDHVRPPSNGELIPTAAQYNTYARDVCRANLAEFERALDIDIRHRVARRWHVPAEDVVVR